MDLSKSNPLRGLSFFQVSAMPEEGAEEVSFAPTAQKTSQAVKGSFEKKESTSLGKRKVEVLAEESDVVRQISQLKKNWNELSPEDVAEELIELHQRITILAEGKESPTCLKMQKQWQNLFFDFVFPIHSELDPQAPMSFAHTIRDIAQKTLEQNSLQPFQELTPLQQREILRFATKMEG